jgi:hypothetical protein
MEGLAYSVGGRNRPEGAYLIVFVHEDDYDHHHHHHHHVSLKLIMRSKGTGHEICRALFSVC